MYRTFTPQICLSLLYCGRVICVDCIVLVGYQLEFSPFVYSIFPRIVKYKLSGTTILFLYLWDNVFLAVHTFLIYCNLVTIIYITEILYCNLVTIKFLQSNNKVSSIGAAFWGPAGPFLWPIRADGSGGDAACCGVIVFVTSLYLCTFSMATTLKHSEDLVPLHFNSNDHTIDDFKVVAIEKIQQNNVFYRTTRESLWIKKLNTIHPVGLNKLK